MNTTAKAAHIADIETRIRECRAQLPQRIGPTLREQVTSELAGLETYLAAITA